jgi:hypothetical protein
MDSTTRSYKQATGRFKLLCTFEAVFTHDKETDLKTANILKTLVSNARSNRDPKYLTISLNNPKIHQYVSQNEAAMDLLKLIGFVNQTNEGSDCYDGTMSLVYTPNGMHQLQEGSRLESLLDEKITKLQKVDTSTAIVKENESKAKARKKETEETRLKLIAMFKEDRERQWEREQRRVNDDGVEMAEPEEKVT